MKQLKLALDWTPNINHIGFFVAQAMDYYTAVQLQVELIDPSEDNYTLTPAKKVEMGQADMALCPLESVISYRTKKEPFDAVALATLFQEDLSAIVVLQENQILSPKDLDGKSYASYKARYEDEIVREMIKNDGGTGTIKLAYPEKLGIWETLQVGEYDATWIFLNWEGVQAAGNGLELRKFKLADFGIPYSYSPIILASKRQVDVDKGSYAAFLEATKKGFLFAKHYPEKATEILAPLVAEQDQDIDLIESQKISSAAYGADESWGKMDIARVQHFLQWLKSKGLEQFDVQVEDVLFQEFD